VPYRARRERRHPTGVNIAHNKPPPLDPLENTIGAEPTTTGYELDDGNAPKAAI